MIECDNVNCFLDSSEFLNHIDKQNFHKFTNIEGEREGEIDR